VDQSTFSVPRERASSPALLLHAWTKVFEYSVALRARSRQSSAGIAIGETFIARRHVRGCVGGYLGAGRASDTRKGFQASWLMRIASPVIASASGSNREK